MWSPCYSGHLSSSKGDPNREVPLCFELLKLVPTTAPYGREWFTSQLHQGGERPTVGAEHIDNMILDLTK